MLGLISAAIGAITEGLKLANTKESRRYIDKLAELKLDLIHEDAKGYDSDDAKIETLYKEIKVIFDAAQQEIALSHSKPK